MLDLQDISVTLLLLSNTFRQDMNMPSSLERMKQIADISVLNTPG